MPEPQSRPQPTPPKSPSQSPDASAPLQEIDEALLQPVACLGFGIRRASRAVTRFFNERLSDTGVRITQTPLLFVLREAGAVTLSDLAQRVGMDQSTLSRNIRPLERDGYVDITAGSSRRERYARLTPAGVAKVEALYPIWREAQAELVNSLGPEMVSVLRTCITRLQSP